jgi:two-component system chemotaxis response regulator CheB
MGSDGKEGAKILKSTGATIIAQDEATSIVYGMPMAVVNAGLADIQLSLPDIITMLSGN